MAGNDFMTIDEVAKLLDAPRSFVAQLVARDAIPYERPERGFRKFEADKLRFRRDAIERWLRSS